MCYGAAIAADLQLENAEQAVILFNEMQERGIPWPNREPLLERASAIIAEAMVDQTRSVDENLAEEISGSPIPDPKLSLEAVRRLLAKPRS